MTTYSVNYAKLTCKASAAPYPFERCLLKCLATSECLLKHPVRSILELGARDCAETLAFHHILNGSVDIYAFECNPATLPVCRQRISGIKRIRLVEKAVGDSDGIREFYQIDPERTRTTWPDGNPGASSMFRASETYPPETYVQRPIQVNTARLDRFLDSSGIASIDLLWMDIQGAELDALRGLGEKIRTVSIIHLEAEFIHIYRNQPLFRDVKRFLNSTGFLLVGFTTFGAYSCDAMFINGDALSHFQHLRTHVVDKLMFPVARVLYNASVKSRSILKYTAAVSRCYRNATDRGVSDAILYEWLRLKGRNIRTVTPSTLPVTIVVPAIERDAPVLELALKSIRKHVSHPIRASYVVGPCSQKLCEISRSVGYRFVDEREILTFPEELAGFVVGGSDRSHWLYQQFLKMSAGEILEAEDCLVIDADTVLVRPAAWEHHGRRVLYCADEFHRPYHDVYSRLTGQPTRRNISFVAHGMLLSTGHLREVKAAIERHSKRPWLTAVLEAVDRRQPSCFSEYETYGHYVYSHYPTDTCIRHSHNRPLSRKALTTLDQLEAMYAHRFSSLSFHYYV